MKGKPRHLKDGSGRNRFESGRHREGRPHESVSRRVFDVEAKAQAAQLNQLEPTWLILYGQYRRRFYAISAAWADPPCVEASCPHTLKVLMREAEDAARLRAAS